MYDLEGSNNVDPLVSGYGQIYLTMKYICPLVFLLVLIFSKPTRACRGYPSSKHVCSTARLVARPHALRPCACLPRGCHLKWNEHLYRSARRRPQLNPRGPAAAGHLQIRAYTDFLNGGLFMWRAVYMSGLLYFLCTWINFSSRERESVVYWYSI